MSPSFMQFMTPIKYTQTIRLPNPAYCSMYNVYTVYKYNFKRFYNDTLKSSTERDEFIRHRPVLNT